MSKFKWFLIIILCFTNCQNDNLSTKKSIDYYFTEASISIRKLISGEFPIDEDRIGYTNAIIFYGIISGEPLKGGTINHYHINYKTIEETLIIWEKWYIENKDLLSEKIITDRYKTHLIASQEKLPKLKTYLPTNWRDLFKGQNVGFSDEIKGVIILDSLPEGF